MRRPSSFKEDRRVQREAKRREKLALKEAPKAERRAERVDPYRGHESQFDPAIPADQQPPPMLGRVVRSRQKD